jgi:ubiquinone/menaquinone biosynthesis C-methylase UbiE
MTNVLGKLFQYLETRIVSFLDRSFVQMMVPQVVSSVGWLHYNHLSPNTSIEIMKLALLSAAMTSHFSSTALRALPNQPLWQWNEMKTVGKDYTSGQEVDVYDETHSNFRDILQESRYILDELFRASPGDSIIDFGCGTGTLLVEAAKRKLAVHGVDVSPAMLQMARSKIQKHDTTGQSNLAEFIQLHHAGFLTYQHDLHPVDFVTTTYALHHLPDLWKQVALHRIHDLMKPNGRLHIRDVVLSTSDSTGTDAPTKIHNFVQEQTKLGDAHHDNGFLKDDAEGHFRDEFSTYDWVMDGMLERAGFEIVKKEVECAGVIATYLCEKK